MHFEKGTVNLDYGGGRFDKATKFLESNGVRNYVYDPFNRSKEHNEAVIQAIKSNGGADTVTCNNVLNVIMEDNIRQEAISHIKSLLKPGGTAYFCVYSGDRTGIGKVTKCGYQLNRATSTYLSEVKQHFTEVSIYKDIIIARLHELII